MQKRADTTISERFRSPAASTAGEVFVTAHRGAFIKDNHVIEAENFVSAVKRARKLGCDMVEVDMHFTAEGTAVVLHDETLDRTTQGSGPVAAQCYNDLCGLKLIHPGTGDAFDAVLPTLEEIFIALGDEMMINVECKTGLNAVPIVSEIARKSGVFEQVSVKTNFRGAAEISKVADILVATQDPVDYIPILIDQIDGIKTFRQVCEDLPISCVECLVECPPSPKGFPALDKLGLTPDGGALFSLEARCIADANNIRRFINTLYVDQAIPGTQWNGGRNRQLGKVVPDSVYSFWIAHGATVIQSDESEFVLGWLRENGFRRAGR